MDKRNGVVVVANDTKSSLLTVKQPDQIITDSLLYNRHLDETIFDTGEIMTISLPIFGINSVPDSEKLYLFVFDLDSIKKITRSKKIEGICSNSLIKIVSIQLNEVKEDDLDTIYVSKILGQ